MITIDQFVQFNEMEKVSAIMQYGHLMAQNIEDNSRIFLYRMEAFYVIASYCIITDQLQGINCFLQINQSIPHHRKLLAGIHPAERQYTTPDC